MNWSEVNPKHCKALTQTASKWTEVCWCHERGWKPRVSNTLENCYSTPLPSMLGWTLWTGLLHWATEIRPLRRALARESTWSVMSACIFPDCLTYLRPFRIEWNYMWEVSFDSALANWHSVTRVSNWKLEGTWPPALQRRFPNWGDAGAQFEHGRCSGSGG